MAAARVAWQFRAGSLAGEDPGDSGGRVGISSLRPPRRVITQVLLAETLSAEYPTDQQAEAGEKLHPIEAGE